MRAAVCITQNSLAVIRYQPWIFSTRRVHAFANLIHARGALFKRDVRVLDNRRVDRRNLRRVVGRCHTDVRDAIVSIG